MSIYENCTSVLYHKRLNCTNNENCTSVGGASALFNSCFRRSAASKLWDPKEENPILSKIKITYLIIVEVTFSNRFNAQTWLSYPSPSPSHQADNFYWELNNRLHFFVKGLKSENVFTLPTSIYIWISCNSFEILRMLL